MGDKISKIDLLYICNKIQNGPNVIKMCYEHIAPRIKKTNVKYDDNKKFVDYLVTINGSSDYLNHILNMDSDKFSEIFNIDDEDSAKIKKYIETHYNNTYNSSNENDGDKIDKVDNDKHTDALNNYLVSLMSDIQNVLSIKDTILKLKKLNGE